MELQPFTLNDLMLCIVGVLGALGGVLAITQRSKCQSCCFGLIKRDVAAVVATERLEATGRTGMTPRLSQDETTQAP
jgi:hypothetical protein